MRTKLPTFSSSMNFPVSAKKRLYSPDDPPYLWLPWDLKSSSALPTEPFSGIGESLSRQQNPLDGRARLLHLFLRFLSKSVFATKLWLGAGALGISSVMFPWESLHGSFKLSVPRYPTRHSLQAEKEHAKPRTISCLKRSSIYRGSIFLN